MNATETKKEIKRHLREALHYIDNPDRLIAECLAVERLGEELKKNKTLSNNNRKNEIIRWLNTVACDWQRADTIKVVMEQVLADGYHIIARGTVNPYRISNSPDPYAMEDEIFANLGKWRFYDFDVRKAPYNKDTLGERWRKEMDNWGKQF